MDGGTFKHASCQAGTRRLHVLDAEGGSNWSNCSRIVARACCLNLARFRSAAKASIPATSACPFRVRTGLLVRYKQRSLGQWGRP